MFPERERNDNKTEESKQNAGAAIGDAGDGAARGRTPDLHPGRGRKNHRPGVNFRPNPGPQAGGAGGGDGVTEVAKGLWIRRADMDVGRLVEYAVRLGVGAVMHRLGFLLELYDLGTVADRERLRESAGGTYSLLDPVLPSQGKYTTRWH